MEEYAWGKPKTFQHRLIHNSTQIVQLDLDLFKSSSEKKTLVNDNMPIRVKSKGER